MTKQPVKTYELPFFLKVLHPTLEEERSLVTRSNLSAKETLDLISDYEKSSCGLYLLDSYSLNPRTQFDFEAIYQGIGSRKISEKKATKKGYNNSHVAYGVILANLFLPQEIEKLEELLEEEFFINKLQSFRGLATQEENHSKPEFFTVKKMPSLIFPSKDYSIRGLSFHLNNSSISFYENISSSVIGHISRFLTPQKD